MKIIILDDSQTIRRMIESHLEELEILENEIYSFDNGDDALAFIQVHGVNIVFFDTDMPKIDALKFTTEFFEIHPDLKKNFFVITTDENPTTLHALKNLGVKRFLNKPIDAEQFNYIVKKEIIKIHLDAKSYSKVIHQQFELIDKHIMGTSKNPN